MSQETSTSEFDRGRSRGGRFRWHLRTCDLPSEDLARRVPELAGIENNPWYVLLMASRQPAPHGLSRGTLLAVLIAISAAILMPFGLSHEFARTSDWLDAGHVLSAYLALMTYPFFFRLLPDVLILVPRGVSNPFGPAVKRARDPLFDLWLANGEPDEIARACLAYYCLRSPRAAWIGQLWIIAAATLIIISFAWFCREFPEICWVLVFPLLVAAYTCGITPFYERVILHLAVQGMAFPRHRLEDPIKDALLRTWRLSYVGFHMVWQGLLVWSFCFLLYTLVDGDKLPHPFEEFILGAPAFWFYSMSAAGVVFGFGLVRSFRANRLWERNLQLMGEKSTAFLADLFAAKLEIEPRLSAWRRMGWWLRHNLVEHRIRFFLWSVPSFAVRIAGSLGIIGLALMETEPIERLWRNRWSEPVYQVLYGHYSMTDILKVRKWHARSVGIELPFEDRGQRSIQFVLPSARPEPISDFEHLLGESRALSLMIGNDRRADDDYHALLSRRSVSSFTESLSFHESPPGWSYGVDLSEYKRLLDLSFYSVAFEQRFPLPMTLRSLRIDSTTDMLLLELHPGMKQLKWISVSSVTAVDLAGFFSTNTVPIERCELASIRDMPDLNFLGPSARIQSLRIFDCWPLNSLDGIERIQGLRNVDFVPSASSTSLTNIDALGLCPNLRQIAIGSYDAFPPEALRIFKDMDLDSLSIGGIGSLIGPKPASGWYGSLREHVEAEAVFIERKVHWLEIIENIIHEIDPSRIAAAEQRAMGSSIINVNAANPFAPAGSPSATPAPPPPPSHETAFNPSAK